MCCIKESNKIADLLTKRAVHGFSPDFLFRHPDLFAFAKKKLDLWFNNYLLFYYLFRDIKDNYSFLMSTQKRRSYGISIFLWKKSIFIDESVSLQPQSQSLSQKYNRRLFVWLSPRFNHIIFSSVPSTARESWNLFVSSNNPLALSVKTSSLF